MKLASLEIGAIAVMLLAIPAQAQTAVSYVGTTTGSTMPGSPTDFIFFDGTNYPFGGPSDNQDVEGTSVYSDLTSFTIQGGLEGGSSSNDANITTPAGQTLQTGFIYSTGTGAAFALTPGLNTGSTFALNPSFNYNDFNVYLMISNTNGDLNDLSVSIDGRENGAVSIGANSQAVSDNSVSGNNAIYVEFNVTGLGNTLTASGGNADLVVSMDGNRVDDNVQGAESYIGAVSFESVPAPEPSTWAMMFVGSLGLLVFVRRNRTRFNA
jgi:hypothetical protein